MSTAHAPRLTSCLGHCDLAGRFPEHHDRLLAVDIEPEALVELLEIAVTWHELDYSEADVVGPRAWLDFAGRHRWSRPEVAERAFSLAVDIVGRRAVGEPPAPTLARVIELVR